MLTFDVSPDGGIIEIDLIAPPYYPYDMSFTSGQVIRLKAVPNSDYEFVSWNGSLSDTANPTTIVLNCNKKITASFSDKTSTTIDTNGTSSTSQTAGNYNYPEADEVTITTNPDIG